MSIPPLPPPLPPRVPPTGVPPQLATAFHITDVTNLPAILQAGGLMSDAGMAARPGATIIGYDHIKLRRLQQIQVDCLAGKPFVGEFVPFYYSPRSVMLYTINRGNTGRPVGCQTSIIHLVSTVPVLAGLGREWAIADGNAGAFHTAFYNQMAGLQNLNWAAIRATSWSGQQHQKAAEFLVKDFVPWSAFHLIGCHNAATAAQVQHMLAVARSAHSPNVEERPLWYY